jgi:glycosyltransferase involved in cell wall biosynthesis
LRHGTGVASYAAALAAGLPAIGRAPDLLLAAEPGGGRAARWLRAAWPGTARATPVAAPPGFRRAWRATDAFRVAQVHVDFHGRLLALRGPTAPGLMHWTYPLPMKFAETRNVYTIHDLIPLRNTKLTDIDARRFRRILRLVAAAADHIITVSETSRRDIVTLLGVSESRVTNTYQPAWFPPGWRAAAAAPARRGHFLFCGTVEPRKNVGRLIAAHRASGAAAPLILAGPDGWRAAEELAAGGVAIRPLAALDHGSQGGGVWRAPWLERPALLDLLRGARALLFPSLAEGFGLPIVEAMALGVPVLTAAGGATGEVAGAAALLVDPRDVAAMAGAIAALDRDAALCQRLAADGLRRAVVFSEAACLARLAAVYDRLGAPPS